MESNNKLKETDINNHTFYYFDEIININNLNLNNILLNEKSYQNILIYNISYKTPYGAKPLDIIYDKVDGFIRKYDGIKYLALPHSEIYVRIFDRIRYLFMLRINISSVSSHNIKIKIDFSSEKPINMHDVVILNKTVFNKNHNHYYYQVYLEKCSYK